MAQVRDCAVANNRWRLFVSIYIIVVRHQIRYEVVSVLSLVNPNVLVGSE